MANMRITTERVVLEGRRNAPMVAFGDESLASDQDTAVYAFFMIKRSHLFRLDRKLALLKKKFGIPPDVLLHCRQLISPAQRAKLNLHHLSTEDARRVIAHAVTLINELRGLVCYAYCSLADVSELGKTIKVMDPDGVWAEHPVNAEAKAMSGILSDIAFLSASHHGITSENCDVYISEDKSIVKRLFGKGSTQAQYSMTLGGVTSSGSGADTGANKIIVRTDELAGLQLADVAAYVCANAKSTHQKYPFFRDQLSRIEKCAFSSFIPATTRNLANPELFPRADIRN
jgi:hypothetical protein